MISTHCSFQGATRASLLAMLALCAVSHAAAPNASAASAPTEPAVAAKGWLHWRGPLRQGTTPEKGLPTVFDANAPLWTAAFPGQSTPVIANGKVYINGYLGDANSPDLQEGISCFDADTGKLLWRYLANDYLSDTIYLRYSTSAPAVDPETGNVYFLGTQGLLICFSADGKQLWRASMMEQFGRLTFPNSRTATPLIDGELVITRGITSAWGANAAAGDRFYAFDKKTGQLVWLSAPGDRPQDNTFSHPLITMLDGKRVLISAGGDSTVVCINARSGDPIFRFAAAKAGAKGGINAAVQRYKDNLIVTHESENIDTSEVGRMASYKLPTGTTPAEPGKPFIFSGTKEIENWRNPLGNLASSPVIAGDRAYIVTGTGEAAAVNLDTGKILWRKKLAPEQRQSSPFYADGYLYIAMYTAAIGGDSSKLAEADGGDGELIVLRPGDTDAEVVSRTTLNGRCYGSPIGYNGKLYIQTDKKLYCFGKPGNNPTAPETTEPPVVWPKPGPAAKLQIIPNEVLLHPGEAVHVRARALDANGFVVDENIDISKVAFTSYIPPTALVKSKMLGAFAAPGTLVADPQPVPSAGAFQGKLTLPGGGEISGVMRGRVLQDIPFAVDFEGIPLTENTSNPPPPGIPNTLEPPTPFAYPPLAWNGCRFRFEIRQSPVGTGNALCKTIDNKLFQRGQVFIGHPDASGYTISADILSEGNRRKGCDIGVICQRYQIVLKWNEQSLEVNSNQERLKVAVPFAAERNAWYRLAARVDIAADGSGVVRAKAWKKGDPEPPTWTLEVPHKTAHREGAPGFYCLTPQEQRAWIDNLEVRKSEPLKP